MCFCWCVLFIIGFLVLDGKLEILFILVLMLLKSVFKLYLVFFFICILVLLVFEVDVICLILGIVFSVVLILIVIFFFVCLGLLLLYVIEMVIKCGFIFGNVFLWILFMEIKLSMIRLIMSKLVVIEFCVN